MHINGFNNYYIVLDILDIKIFFFILHENIYCGQYYPASILYKSTVGRYLPVSYPDGPITARCTFIKNAYWVEASSMSVSSSEYNVSVEN